MKQRFLALDLFRGATVALMILVNNPGSWNYIYTPLEHASWHGCTPTDLVFPFFLFAVGNSIAFGMPKLKAGKTGDFFSKVLKRSLLIFLIGILLNWAPFIQWKNDELVFKTLEFIRIPGVLQRIAFSYLVASILIYLLSARALLYTTASLLLLYWIASWYFGTSPDPYSLEGFWGTPIDRFIFAPDHIYKGEGVPFDPEGLISSIGSICQVSVGYLIGRHALSNARDFRLVSHLFIIGSLCVFIGFAWDLVFPINKKIWTSSFVLYTTGIATMILALVIYLTELRSRRPPGSYFFEIFGKNPLLIFILSGLIPRLQALIRIPVTLHGEAVKLSPFSWFYRCVLDPVFSSPYNASLAYALITVAFYALIAYLLDRRRLYFKI